MIGYILVNHEMLNAFMERWHSETYSFHLVLSDMSMTLDDVVFATSFYHGETSRPYEDYQRRGTRDDGRLSWG